MKKYKVITAHKSEYPNPITFTKGTLLQIGEKYQANPLWDNWYLCSVADQQDGWVPNQVIEWLNATHGCALQDYTAKELDVRPGEAVQVIRQLNGWAWCIKIPDEQHSGWLPQEKLTRIE